MTTHSHRRIELSRLAIAGAFVLAGLAGAGQTASAGPPLVDDGGSGGGGTVASGMLDEAARSNDLIAMSGGTTTSSGTLDETARANDLIALSPSDDFDTAADRRGRPH